jgi:hypothetical protein
MSSNMITYLIAAITMITTALVLVGVPALAVVVTRYFKLKERELAFEVESREKSAQQQFALEERLQRLEDALASLDPEVRARLGTDPSAAPADVELPQGSDPKDQRAAPLDLTRTAAR